MPPTAVVTLDDASKGASCICVGLPVVTFFGCIFLGIKGDLFNIIFIISICIGLVLGILVMKDFWSGYK